LTALTGDAIKLYQMRVLIAALELEIKGMKKTGRSAYTIIKEQFNLQGNRKSVLNQLKEIYVQANVSAG